MNDKIQGQGNPVSARRRLLRGALSVPTVVTLSSGSALAASSALMCASKLPIGLDVGALDNYFRVQAYTATRTNGTVSLTLRLVKGSDITALASNKGFSAGAFGSMVWIDVANGTDATPWVNQVPPITPTVEAGKYVALRFANLGTDLAPAFTVTGLSNSATPGYGTGKVMSASCWSSFKN